MIIEWNDEQLKVEKQTFVFEIFRQTPFLMVFKCCFLEYGRYFLAQLKHNEKRVSAFICFAFADLVFLRHR